MSNFTFVLADRLRRDRVESWLSDRGAPDREIERRDLALGWRLFIVAADAPTHVQASTFFRGTCVAAEHNTIVLDVDGWARCPDTVRSDAAAFGGEFVVADWDARRARIRRDVFSGVLLAYSRMPGVLMASDSLLILTDLRRHLGGAVTSNVEVLAARSVRSGHASQQMSPETQVREISVVPVGRELVMHAGVVGRMELRGPLLTERLFAPAGDYATQVRVLAARVAGVVRAMGPASAGQGELGLSGGYDSRLVLAGARVSGSLGDYRVTSANTVPAHATDFAVASELSARFAFELNASMSNRRLEPLPGSPLAIWGSTHLGVYDRMLPARPHRRAGSSVSLSGVGAEILKGNWLWQSIDELVRKLKISGIQRESLISQIEKTLRSVGGDPTWSDASEIYYLAHRNGIHGTGHISTNMSQLRPLQMFPMAVLGHSRRDGAPRVGGTSAPLVGSYHAIADMLIVLDPELAAHRFDRPDKDLTAASIEERLARLGGPVAESEFPDVAVYGRVPETPPGASQLGLRIAERFGLGGLMETEELLTLGEMFALAAPAELADHYSHLVKVARNAMINQSLPPANSGAALPKVLSLAILG